MAGQRIQLFPVWAILLGLLAAPSSWAAGAPTIVLPDPFAVELPAGVSSVGPDDEPLKALIASAQVIPAPDPGAAPGANPVAGHSRVAAALPQDRVGVGVWRVIWSVWDAGAPDHPVARRESFLFVMPHGMTPVAASGKNDATAGNNTAHIARDPSGAVHMVWTDAWRPGTHDGAVYRRARVLPDGSVRFETGVIDLGQHPTTWTAMPALAVSGDTVHFAWQEDGTVRYRSLKRDGTAWHWSPPVDTKALSPGRDTGPAIAVDATGVHIVTPAGLYTTSSDGGLTWTTETVPLGRFQRVKTASLTIDRDAHPIVAASLVVSGPGELADDHGSGAYWALRLARRVATGVWEAIPGPEEGRPEWAPPARSDQDVLSDWARVAADPTGGLHVTWHGTAVSRIYANDRAYYAWRGPDGTWRPPIPLREPDPGRGIGWSYAPSITLDGDRALVLPFYDLHSGQQDRGFDADLRLFEDGRSLAPALPVTRFAANSLASGEPKSALSAWFPGTAPTLYRDADGKVWADVLATLVPNGIPAPCLVVWERLDVTDWLKTADQ